MSSSVETDGTLKRRKSLTQMLAGKNPLHSKKMPKMLRRSSRASTSKASTLEDVDPNEEASAPPSAPGSDVSGVSPTAHPAPASDELKRSDSNVVEKLVDRAVETAVLTSDAEETASAVAATAITVAVETADAEALATEIACAAVEAAISAAKPAKVPPSPIVLPAGAPGEAVASPHEQGGVLKAFSRALRGGLWCKPDVDAGDEDRTTLIEDPTVGGWMSKKAQAFPYNWKTRYVVYDATSQLLCYYPSEYDAAHGTNLKGRIDGVTALKRLEDESHGFVFEGSQQPFYARALSDEDRARWEAAAEIAQ